MTSNSNMDAMTLWAELQLLHPERTERLAKIVGPVSGTADSFMKRLHGLWSNMNIANDRCGYIGNPYEQSAEDFDVVMCAAKRIV